ncbi:putative oxalyl-CoA decarboxylase [Tieghemostelium lacteum]|uniref:2-hydroxyacyl-CoA lyase n=1 Tax=Tieghemostelium lacteum TaxID=361077 RepID=A0A151ZER9_TIELA|nr:putative oxalyl-CoA decarboxylase [Tieghemostelium lacteum]|eukprot:KYQ92409.1 putative oxalyl-CoA decarboxylase [Tieghemostelium lacteum]
MNGIEIIAKSIKSIGIEHIFGIVGVPITPIAYELQKIGMEFYGFRNEQSASYATSVVGYLSGKPGLCMTVSGPGMVHALPGLLNAQSNCWPMILMSSTVSTLERGKGGFQESDQMKQADPLCKKCYHVPSVDKFPAILVDAYLQSIKGRPGPVYIEIPSEIIQNKTLVYDNVNMPIGTPSVPYEPTDHISISGLVGYLLSESKRPVIIGGKGAAMSRAENELREFVKTTGIPFLPSPMGKGLVPDDDPSVVSAARSMTLKNADIVLVLGARLNWMFNYGNSPTFAENVQFLVVDVDVSEFRSTKNVTLLVQSDIKKFLVEANKLVKENLIKFRNGGELLKWKEDLQKEMLVKGKQLEDQMKQPQVSDSDYLGYHQVYGVLRDYLFTANNCRDYVFVNEGANTMDIGRLCIPQFEARTRLDAGTLGTMGIGVGYALAASIVHRNPQRRVICVQGDSAFGFSGMEMELAVRYQLPIVFVVINNNGVYEGLEEKPSVSNANTLPPTSLSIDCRYDKMMESFGGTGYFISTLSSLTDICKQISSQSTQSPTLLNIKIKPSSIKPKIIH